MFLIFLILVIPDRSQELDETIFTVANEARIAEVHQACYELTQKMHQAHEYVDTSNFTLRCLVCRQGLTGQQEAVQHAKATGHQNFSEYK